MTSVAVLGGGIAGLTAAAVLRQHDCPVSLFEASDRVGGVIRSVRQGGFLADLGPNSMLAPPPGVMSLFRTGALARERVYTSAVAHRRFVVRDGTAVAIPTTPGELLGTPLFSSRAKWRLLTEMFRTSRPPAGEESLTGLIRRRLGQEIVDYALNPMVAGIYAGDPDQLSSAHAMPTLGSLEARYGSLVRGAITTMQQRRHAAAGEPEGRLFTFRDGMETIPRELARELGDAVHTSTTVTGLYHDEHGWTVSTDGPSGSMTQSFDAVICTLPAHVLPQITFGGEGLAEWGRLASVTYSPVAVVVSGYRREDVAHPLDGFGVLVPAVEKRRTLGSLFSSTLFAERAPAGFVTVTTFVGGARDPGMALGSESRLVEAVELDLRDMLGVSGTPAFRMVWQHARGIPQYNLGYGAQKAAMDELERLNPGLFFAGSHRNGVAVGDVMTSGLLAGEAARETVALPVGSA